MFKDLRIGWRQLVGDPGYSAVVLLGLAVAIACGLLTLQLVFNVVLPDPTVPEPARVVNFEMRGDPSHQEDGWFDQAPFVLAGALRDSHAPLTAVARALDGHVFVAHAGDRQERLNFQFADPEFIDVFGLRAVAGDLRAAFIRPDAVGLTSGAAARLFPAGDALGKVILIKDQPMTVVAVVRDPLRGFDQPHDAFAAMGAAISHVEPRALTSWGSIQGKVFARLAPGASPMDAARAAEAAYEASPAGRNIAQARTGHGADDNPEILRAIPLTDAYLQGGGGGESRRRQLLALAGGSALMLALAMANYINLTSVRTLARTREIAVRKTLGASPWRLVAQFMAEAALAAGLAAALGLLLAWWLAPTLAQLLFQPLSDDLFAPTRLACLAGAALAMGVAAGLYPVRIALNVDCGTALAGRSHDEGSLGRAMRRAMTALQFTLALAIGGAAGVMVWQNRYIAALPHGIRTEGLLTVDMPDGFSGKADAINAAFAQAVAHEPGVRKTAWIMDVPGRGQDWSAFDVTRPGAAAPLRVYQLTVSDRFFDLFGVPLVAGRLRLPAEAAAERLVVIDASTSRALGFATPAEAVEQLLSPGNPNVDGGRPAVRIVGVCADVRMEQAHQGALLHAFELSARPQETLVLQGSDLALLREAVDRVWRRFFSEDRYDVSTIEEALGAPYATEHRLIELTLATTGVALLLSAFGVYALAAYGVRRSAREIVVRKLYGASRARIARLLVGEFVPLLGVAAVVGLPVAGWLASTWLASYVERSSFALLALPVALVALVAMTTLAALRHGVIAMNMRPTQALRD